MPNLSKIARKMTNWMQFDAETERSFLRDYTARFATQRRIAKILALAVNLIYLGVEILYVLSDEKLKDVFIRIIIPLRLTNLAIMLILLILLFQPAAKTNEYYVCCCAYATAISNCLMILGMNKSIISPDFYFIYKYYDGSIFVVFLFLFGLTKMLTKPTLALTFILLSISVFYFDSDDLMKLSKSQAIYFRSPNPPFYTLIVFALIGCYISFDQEHTARHTFLRKRELRRAREETESKAAELLALKEQSRLMAEQQNQEKSRFIANAAHDLTNAMQPVDSFLEVGLSAVLRGDMPLAREYVKEAKTANRALRTAINAMLDISKLESGIIKLEYGHFDVRRLAAEIFNQHELLAYNHAVKLRLSRNRGAQAIVHSDPHHLRRVLLNLVSNGIKYADASKNSATVAIAIVCRGQSIRVDVIDNGIGIPASEHENVFKPLHQLNNPERNRDKGVGLGLSIVHSTINLLAGHQISMASKPGIGTRFTLTLPKGDPLDIDAPISLAAADCLLDGPYVLLVENDVLVRKSVVALLKANGAEYEAVGSVEELLDLLQKIKDERQFDVVVSDYRLPDSRTAVDVFAALNAHYGEDIPGLVITGETADLSNMSALKDRKILRKPVEARHLLAEINRLSGDGLN